MNPLIILLVDAAIILSVVIMARMWMRIFDKTENHHRDADHEAGKIAQMREIDE